MRESNFNRLLFWDKLILLLFGVLILRLLVPSYLELCLNKTRNSVKITLQTIHRIPSSYVNTTVMCGTYLYFNFKNSGKLVCSGTTDYSAIYVGIWYPVSSLKCYFDTISCFVQK